MSRNQQSSGGKGEVVVPLRRDDRSGLLDIHALSSIIDTQRRGGATAASVALPTFGTPWALQEVKPAVPEPRTSAPARAVVVGPDHRPLYVMIAALSVAVASLGAYVLMRPTPTVVVERAAVVAGPEAVEGEGAEGDAEAEAKAKAKAEAEANAKADAALLATNVEPSADAEATEATEPRATRPGNPKTTRPGNPKTTRPGNPKLDPKATPKDGGAISVECVIDPTKCGKGKTKPGPVQSNDEPLLPREPPTAPSSSDIRNAMAVVKPQAKACGPRHGGTTGEKVRVKLSVTGSTGKITSAQALDDHAGTALGKCVADALSKAELPKFGKPQAGVMYAITL